MIWNKVQLFWYLTINCQVEDSKEGKKDIKRQSKNGKIKILRISIRGNVINDN